jgi:hypothetical protein
MDKHLISFSTSNAELSPYDFFSVSFNKTEHSPATACTNENILNEEKE